jgi:hypothetical protein
MSTLGVMCINNPEFNINKMMIHRPFPQNAQNTNFFTSDVYYPKRKEKYVLLLLTKQNQWMMILYKNLE